MSDICKWLHEQLEQLPLMTHPFIMGCVPQNGIYFFCEQGEAWGHGGNEPRIIRIGSHTGQDNLRTRISETYLLDERKLSFAGDKPKPADRSIFRKNLGRALLNRAGDDYLKVWEIDFTARRNRERFRHLRDMKKEKGLERDISALLRDGFSFTAVAVESAAERRQLEKHLIGTLADCELCRTSRNWLGRFSPKKKIREGNLWQVQNLKAGPLGASDREAVLRAIHLTRAYSNDGKSRGRNRLAES